MDDIYTLPAGHYPAVPACLEGDAPMAATKTAKKTSENRKPRTKKPKQAHLPGMEPPRIPKIDKLAEDFVEARDFWQGCKPAMITARDLLESAMQEAKLTRYETLDGRIVELIASEKVSVTKKKEADDE